MKLFKNVKLEDIKTLVPSIITVAIVVGIIIFMIVNLFNSPNY